MELTPAHRRGKVFVSFGMQGICPDGKNMQGLWALCGGGKRTFRLPEVRTSLRQNGSGIRKDAGGEAAGSARETESGEERGQVGGSSPGKFTVQPQWKARDSACNPDRCAVAVLAFGGPDIQDHVGNIDRLVCSDAFVPGRGVRWDHYLRDGCRVYSLRLTILAGGVSNV